MQQLDARFAAYREALGLPGGLDFHSLRRSYVTHPIEDGWDALFVQQQCAHDYASTTGLYTCVSSDYRTRTLRRALDQTITAALGSASSNAGPELEQGGVIRPRRRVTYRWRLREVMATRGLFTTTELVPLLAERGITLSASQVHRLVTGTPERLSLPVLAALCDILDVSPAELIATRAENVVPSTAAAGEPSVSVVDLAATLRPKRARVRPEG